MSTCLLRNDVQKLGHFLGEMGWKSTEELQVMTGLKSVHIVSNLKEEICNALPGGCRNWIGLSSTQDMQSFPEIIVSPVINEKDEGEDVDSVLSFKTPQIHLSKDASKKAIYYTLGT